MKTFEVRPWELPRWINSRIVRAGIRRFIRRCVRDGIIKPPILDVGCGYRSNFREINLIRYDTLDACAGVKPAIVADVCCMTQWLGGLKYQTVIATEVLEHVYKFRKAIDQCRKILNPGGRFVMTTPFWFPIHEKPYQDDFWRFTPRAVEAILRDAGFVDVCVTTTGLRRTRPLVICAHACKPE